MPKGPQGPNDLTAILLARNFKTIDEVAAAGEEELSEINGIGPIVAKCIHDFFHDADNKALISRLKNSVKTPLVSCQRWGRFTMAIFH